MKADAPVIVLATPGWKGRDSSQAMERILSYGFERSRVAMYRGFDGRELGIWPLNIYRHGSEAGQMTESLAGCFLSHLGIWKAIQAMADLGSAEEGYLVVEEDAVFHAGWKERVDEAMKALPHDWVMFFVGPCNCGSPDPISRVAGDLYRALPLCLHAYYVRTSMAKHLVDACGVIDCPVDIALFRNVFPIHPVYALLPRCVDQVDTPLIP